MENLVVKNVIEINASAEKVWDILINPAKTKLYMFGCEAVSDWKVGSVLNWEMIHEGKKMIPVRGIILASTPYSLLKYTVIDSFASYADILENHLYVTYSLNEHNKKTTLTVSQDGFETAAEGEKRYKDVYNNGNGWDPVLIQIKKIAEEKQ